MTTKIQMLLLLALLFSVAVYAHVKPVTEIQLYSELPNDRHCFEISLKRPGTEDMRVWGCYK